MDAATYRLQIALLEAHFQQTVTKETQVVWWTSLDGVSDEDFTAACEWFRREPGRQFIPRPNDVLAWIAANREARRPFTLSAGEYDAAAAYAREEAAHRPSEETPQHAKWKARLDAARQRWGLA